MSLDLTSDLLQINFKMPRGSKNGMYTFDRFKLDSEKLMLYRDEIEITLPPKIVKTLAVLIENRGSILSKDELIDKVWGDSIVEESNLSQNLYVLRKTLGSKPDGGQYIETLRRRGYRFNAEVRSHSKNESVVQNDVPLFRVPLIGREREIDEVVELLLKDDARLVTVSGVGGVGKTSLAKSVAERMRGDREVFFVELASITRPELVVSAIANALSLRDSGDESLLERIKEDLEGRSILILLDNFEQVLKAAPFLAELTTNNKGVRILVTSRVPLHLKAESIYVLPPLETPEMNGLSTSFTELSNSSAVHLFVERAKQAQPKFDLTSENIKDVANICAQLGGLPLAIELAAARMRFMSPSAVLKRLEKQLDFLQGVKRDAPDRQQTMRETIAWSFDLLNEQEQKIFARLGVFSGGFDLSAAEFVCSEESDESANSLLEVVTSLVEHNLLTVRNARNSEPRIFMLEVVREFAEEALTGQEAFENARNAHADYFLRLGEEAEPQLLAARSSEWLDRLETEHDNLRAALSWSLKHDPSLGQRLAGAIWRFWWLHGHIREACEQLGSFLSIPNADHTTRAKMLVGATFLNRLAGNSERSRIYAEEGVKLAYSAGDLRTGALSLNQLGFLALDVGDFAKAERNFGMGLKQAEELGDIQILALLNNGLGELSRSKGDYKQAAEYYGRALGFNREAGDRVRQTTCLINLGATALMQNDRFAAGEFYRNGLEISSQMEDMNGTLYCLEGIAGSYWALHEPERASLIFGAAHAGRQKNNLLLEPADQVPYEESVALVRKSLGSESFKAGFSKGGEMGLETAISLALDGSKTQLPPSLQPKVVQTDHQARSENVVVERRGNVLRLVDWGPSKVDAETDEQTVSTDAPVAVNNGSLRRKLISWAASAAVITAVIFLAVFGYRNWFASATATERKELSIARLTNSNYVRDAMISPDGNFFVYNEDLGESSRVWLQQTGTSTRKEIIPGGKWQVCCKTFTPDGRYIYFLASGIGEKKNALYRIATLGGTLEKILDGVNSAVSFSPNGEQMVFLRYMPEQNVSTFVIASSDGKGEEREIYRAEIYTLQAPAWSPDGKKVAFASPKRDSESPGVCTLSTLDLNTNAVSPVSAERWGTCFRIAWLPDGSGFAMVGTRDGETNSSKRDQVYLISYPSGQSRRLTIDANRHEPDSLGVANDGAILAVPYNRSSQIWVMDANGDSRSAKQLTSGTADGRGSIAPLADGRVGYTARSGDELGVWIINGDGSNPTQVGDAAAVQDLQVTPDGKYFVYANEIGQESTLYRMGVDGSDPVVLTSKEEFVIDSTVAPDGSSVVYDVWKTDRKSHDVVLKRLPLSGGDTSTLSTDDCSVPMFSPDGSYISCIYFAGPRMAVLSAKDGSKIAEFKPLPSSLLNPGAHWTPDSLALVYIVHQKNVCNVWKQSISGGKPEQLTNFTSGSCYNLEFSPDGSRLYLARGDELRDAVLITNYK